MTIVRRVAFGALLAVLLSTFGVHAPVGAETLGEVSGTVLSDGSPVSTSVELERLVWDEYWTSVGSVATDEAGAYRFTDVDPGTYRVRARSVGSTWSTWTWHPAAALGIDAAAIEVVGGVAVTDVDISLVADRGVLNITVDGPIDPQYMPLAVFDDHGRQVADRSDHVWPEDWVLDATWHLRLPAGDYRVLVGDADGEAIEGEWAPTWYPDVKLRAQSSTASVVAEQVTEIDVAMQPADDEAVVVVVDPTNVPVAGVEVSAEPYDQVAGVSDAHGEVLVTGVAVSTRVAARPDPGTGYASSFGFAWPGTRQSLRLRSVQAGVSGTVTGPDGTPLAGVVVCSRHQYPWDPCGAPDAFWGETTTLTAADGSYLLPIEEVPRQAQVRFIDPTGTHASQHLGGGLRSGTPVPVGFNVVVPGVDAELEIAGGISGTVRDTDDAPVVGAEVRAVDDTGQWYESTTTSVEGTYELGHLPPGPHRVEFVPPEGSPLLGELYDDVATIDQAEPVEVTSAQVVAGVDATLSVGSSIAGTVTMPDGSDFTASLWDWPAFSVSAREVGGSVDFPAATSPDGSYVISGLRPGDYVVEFGDGTIVDPDTWMTVARGYGVFYDAKTSRADADVVSVGEGEQVLDIDGQLLPGAVLSGVVTGPDGTPLEGVVVSLVRSGQGGYAEPAVSGGDGSWSISDVEPGQYVLAFEPEAAAVARAWYPGVGARALAEPLDLAPGDVVGGLDVQLGEGGEIAGAVTDDQGAPIPAEHRCDVVVVVRDAFDGLEMYRRHLCDSSAYEIGHLPPGRYLVEFTESYYSSDLPYAPEFFDDARRQHEATIVVVESGVTTDGVDAALDRFGGITGAITDAQGDPVVSELVAAVPVDWSSAGYLQTYTGGNGGYSLPELVPGEYHVVVGDDWRDREYYDDVFDEADATPVTVLAGEVTAGIDVERGAEGSIAGTVRTDEGDPVAGARVEISRQWGYDEAVTTTTAADGAFSVTGLVPGDYVVRVIPDDPYLRSAYWPDSVSPYEADIVRVGLDEAVTGIDFALDGAGALDGAVVDGLGDPVGDAVVYVYAGDAFAATTTTAADGTWSVSGLLPGDHKLQVVPPDGIDARQAWFGGGVDLASAGVVAVVAGTSTTADVTLPDSNRVQGLVLDPGGAPLPGASVYASGADYSSWAWAITDAEGRYELLGLGSGPHTVSASPPYDRDELLSASTDVELVGDTELDLTLEPEASIAGTVVDASGSGVGGVTVTAEVDGSGRSTTTADDGTFRLGQLRAGDHVVSFRLNGSSEAVLWWDGAQRADDADPVAVATGQHVTGIDAQLPPANEPGRIRGTLVDPLGDPLANVRVTARPVDGIGSYLEVTTGADGTYELKVRPGAYRVTFRASTAGVLTSEWYDDVPTMASATVLDVNPGASLDGIDADLPIGGSLHGNLPGGGSVQLESLEGDLLESSVGTSADGRWSLTNVRPGSYRVVVHPSTGPRQYVPGTFDPTAATVVEVSARSSTTGLDTDVRPGGSIIGTVTDGGLPLTNRWVTLWRDGSEVAWAATGPDGAFEHAGLAPGTYQVAFHAESELCQEWYCPVPDVVQWFDGAATVDDATDVVVVDGQVTSGVDADLAGDEPPSAPRDLVATPGDGEVALAWSAPADDGGSPVTGYHITVEPGGATTSVSGATTAVVDGLDNGTAYTFSVTAENDNGIGPAAEVGPATPAALPGAPGSVEVVPGDGHLAVTWAAPSGTGGIPLTGYEVTTTPHTGTRTVSPAELSVDLTGLDNGTAYVVAVRALNAVGAGSPATSDPAVPLGLPGPPTSVAGEPASGQVQVSWLPPADDGGSPVVSYTVTASPGGATATVAGSVTTAAVLGLTNGTDYTFVVTATTAVGEGPPSSPSAPVAPAGLPSAPTGVALEGGVTSASMTWTAPGDDGGSPLVRHEVQVEGPGGTTSIDVAAPSTSAELTSLSSGQHRVRVRAVNATGAGPWSPWSGWVMVGFSDVDPDNVFAADIAWLTTSGITAGYADGSFRPGAYVGRQEMAAFLYRAAGSPEGGGPTCDVAPFVDVPVTHVFCGEITWLVEAGITQGFGDGSFRPNEPVSRQAMSAFLHRMAGADPGPFADPGFRDVPAGHLFQLQVWWMAQTGITSGYGDGTFRPAAAVTRQAMAKFLRSFAALEVE